MFKREFVEYGELFFMLKYDGTYKDWWNLWGKWLVYAIIGIIGTVLACVFSGPCGAAATASTVGAAIAKIALATVVGAAISLAIGGTIAGIQSAQIGDGFWEGFEGYVNANWAEALITSFAISAVTVAIGNMIEHFQCFKEGTLVETEDGLKPIEEIEVGDKVLAYDEETGEQAYKKVVRLFRNETKEWYNIYVNGEKIECTGGHPFFVASEERFMPARELKIGQTLLLSDGNCVIIEDIKVKKLFKPETTYNFEVKDFHTYYVTESNVLVHNVCAEDIYKNVKDSPNYDPDFEPAHKTTFDKIKRADLARDLQEVDPGKWVKAYQNGYIDGSKYSLHYFKNQVNGHVFNVKYVSGWVIK